MYLPHMIALLALLMLDNHTVAHKSLAQEHCAWSSCDHVPVIAKKYILLATIYRINTPHTLITKIERICSQTLSVEGRAVVPPWEFCDGWLICLGGQHLQGIATQSGFCKMSEIYRCIST